METSDLVEVIFVGGLRHGQREMISTAHGRRITFEKDGLSCTYESHTWYGQGRHKGTQATFCPVGMPEATYLELLRTIPAPPRPPH